jgi:hypothetical protein
MASELPDEAAIEAAGLASTSEAVPRRPVAQHPAPRAIPDEEDFAEVAPQPQRAVSQPPQPAVQSLAAEVAVPVEMVERIAQRVIAQISDKVIREIAWEVIPDLAETIIKKEIERLKAELAKL